MLKEKTKINFKTIMNYVSQNLQNGYIPLVGIVGLLLFSEDNSIWFEGPLVRHHFGDVIRSRSGTGTVFLFDLLTMMH
jgi:hypothetical protein